MFIKSFAFNFSQANPEELVGSALNNNLKSTDSERRYLLFRLALFKNV